MVARLLWEQDAAGSSPVTSTISSVHNESDEHSIFFAYLHNSTTKVFEVQRKADKLSGYISPILFNAEINFVSSPLPIVLKRRIGILYFANMVFFTKSRSCCFSLL